MGVGKATVSVIEIEDGGFIASVVACYQYIDVPVIVHICDAAGWVAGKAFQIGLCIDKR